MSYQKYKGKEKYHFRYYRRTQNHPFLVVLVTKEHGDGEKYLISGFKMTSSTSLFQRRPSRYIKLDINPDPNSTANSYVNIDLVEHKPAKHFTRPIRGWTLSKEDQNKIDNLLAQKKK